LTLGARTLCGAASTRLAVPAGRSRIRRAQQRPAAEKPAKRLRERLSEPEAFLSRTDLREFGLERRAVDAVFRACPVVELPGYSRPLVRVEDYRRLLADSTYGPDRVAMRVAPLVAR
jgi:hypothetical protein